MSFNHKHINEELNFNDIQVPQENVLTSYYYDKLLSIFNLHYNFCDLYICTDKNSMIILKNKISGTETYDTLLYLIPKTIDGVLCFNLKFLRFKSFTTKQKYIGTSSIVNLIVDLSSIIKINRCFLHLPSNEAPGFDFYLTCHSLKWENIKFLIRHKIKLFFDNYMFCINDANLQRYGEVNWEHYKNYSDQSKQDSILTDLGNVFYPLVGDINGSGTKVLNRTKLNESIDFNEVEVKDNNSLTNNFQNIYIENIVKKYIKDTNLYVVSNDKEIFVKTNWNGVTTTLIYIMPAGQNQWGKDTKKILFTKHYARMFDKQQNGDPDALKAYEFDSTSTLWIVYDLLKLYGFQSIKKVKIKVPEETHNNIRFGFISAREFSDKLLEIFSTNEVKFTKITAPTSYPHNYRIYVTDMFAGNGYDTNVFSTKLLLSLTTTWIGLPFELFNSWIRESVQFNDIKDTCPLLTPETIIREALKNNMPRGHKDEADLYVVDYDDIKQYHIKINGEELAKIIVNIEHEENTTMYIEWNFSIRNAKIWDSNISKIFNYLLSIPLISRYIFFRGKSKLPIHLDLRILNLDRLLANNTIVRWEPGFDFHGVPEYCKAHNINMEMLIKKLTKVFNSYKFNDDDSLLP